MPDKPKVIAVVGPTASGKSDYAVDIALWLNKPAQTRRFGIKGAEIISADSRQVYKGLDIGSGKVPKDKNYSGGAYLYRGIPHHMLDVASPKRVLTAADFKVGAEKAVRKIISKGKLPIVCGGTGFYIDALLDGLDIPDVKPNPKLRAKLEALSTEKLFERLSELDPDRASSIDRMNRRRLIRSLEIVISTGKPVPKPRFESLYRVLKIGLAPKKEILESRIHKRLISRFKQGMSSEVRRIHLKGVPWRRLDDMGLEYRYVSRYLRGQIGRSEMLAELESEILDYSKRQMTWFRRDKNIIWFPSPKKNFKPTVTDFLIDRK